MQKIECLVYNLYFLPAIGTYLPNAFIVEEERGEKLGYMVAKAIPENLPSYNIHVFGTPHEKLLSLIEELNPEFLEAKFAKKGRKKYALNQLYEDAKIKNLMGQYLTRKMKTFLEVMMEHQYPLCLEVERKVLLEDIRIRYDSTPLIPQMSFRKTQTGIHYNLGLVEGKNNIHCKDHDIHLVLDEPAYVVKDYVLYALVSVNANKLKPFLKKDSVFIPAHLTKTYFQKFIMDLVSKVDIHTDGFAVLKSKEIQSVSFDLTKDFMVDEYLLDLVFDYGFTTFKYSEAAIRRSALRMDDAGEITIYQAERNNEEEKYVSKLIKLGLVETNAKRFRLEDGEDPFSIIGWIGRQQATLVEAGFKLPELKIENKKIVVGIPSIKINLTSNNDWFDIGGFIKIGEYQIAFVKIIDNIRQEDPFYRLPDGKYFIIPSQWMSKYSSLAQFGKNEGENLKVRKSNYTLVEELEDMAPSVQDAVVSTEEIEYHQSPYLRATLRPYQLEGVKWLLSHQKNDLGACLADDMGLGKTLQTLAVLNYTKDHLEEVDSENSRNSQLSLFAQERVKDLKPLRALIILPASLIFNWYEEVKKFSPRFHLIQYVGPKRSKFRQELDKFDLVLTTYQTALRDIDYLNQIEWNYIILDESQMIKNKESKVFQAVNILSTKYKISLSGTPIENALSDLWSQMQFINPGMLGSYAFFKENYQIPIERQGDEAALDSLKTLVQPFILRRRKEEVATDLPPLTEQIQYISMPKAQSDIYEKEKSVARNHLLIMDEKDPAFRFQVFKSLMYLRQIANHPILIDEEYAGRSGKFEDVIAKLDLVLSSDHKVLIFSSFTSHLSIFEEYLAKEKITFAKLTGSSTQKQRKANVALFQNDSACQIFLISIKAGGTGLNLTEADYVFILDPWWNPFVESQAIARAHRIGQDNPVSVIKFITKDTIEEKIIRMQARKKVLSAEIIEKPEQLSLTKSDLKELLL